MVGIPYIGNGNCRQGSGGAGNGSGSRGGMMCTGERHSIGGLGAATKARRAGGKYDVTGRHGARRCIRPTAEEVVIILDDPTVGIMADWWTKGGGGRG